VAFIRQSRESVKYSRIEMICLIWFRDACSSRLELRVPLTTRNDDGGQIRWRDESGRRCVRLCTLYFSFIHSFDESGPQATGPPAHVTLEWGGGGRIGLDRGFALRYSSMRRTQPSSKLSTRHAMTSCLLPRWCKVCLTSLYINSAEPGAASSITFQRRPTDSLSVRPSV